jgi:hypothetical protein
MDTFMDGNYMIEEGNVASECYHLHCLIKLDQNGESILDYTQAFNRSYDYWKTEISLKVAAIWYMKGLKSATIGAKL